jgi:hypothetical protein
MSDDTPSVSRFVWVSVSARYLATYLAPHRMPWMVRVSPTGAPQRTFLQPEEPLEGAVATVATRVRGMLLRGGLHTRTHTCTYTLPYPRGLGRGMWLPGATVSQSQTLTFRLDTHVVQTGE